MRRCAMLLTLLMLAGCGESGGLSPTYEPGRSPARPRAAAQPKPQPKPIRRPPAKPLALASDAPLGRVVSVNPNLRFAVIDFGLGRLPGVGDRLGVFRNGYKVGEIKITGPQQEMNIVGNVLSGDVRSDDQVRRE